MTKSNDYGLLLQLARNTVRRKHFDAPGPYLVENFATEVLAIAIRVDPAPIKRLLSDLPALAGRESRSVKAATQQRVWARSDQDSRWQLGIVDLMLWIEHEDGTASEVWVEVKAGSLVTSRQLGTYLTAAEGAAAYIKTLPDVVTLWPPGQELPSKFVGRVETYTWDRLIDAIRPEDGAEWAALKKFIADRGLANHEPVPTDEALVKAIDEALGRTSEFRVVRSKGGSTRWRREYSIRTELARQFASGSDYVIRLLSPHWVRLYIGLSYPLGVPTLRVQLGYAWDYPIPTRPCAASRWQRRWTFACGT